VSSHIDELITLYDIDSEWFGEGLASVFQPVAEQALAPLAAYVRDPARWIYGRGHAMDALAQHALAAPSLHERAVQALVATLEDASANDPFINASLITELVTLGAVESLPVIRRAFELGSVNESIVGDWTMVLDELGVEPDPEDPLVIAARAKPRPAAFWGQAPPASLPMAGSGGGSKKSAAKKKKAKRKMERASRKANKKRR
jgi:hypothetical protein